MIESEEKRKRLIDTITYWCERTKTDHLLRDGDIYGLVSHILEEFYLIHLCCGHLVRELDESIYIAFNDLILDRSDMEYRVGEVSGRYCKDCAEKYKKEFGAWEVKLNCAD